MSTQVVLCSEGRSKPYFCRDIAVFDTDAEAWIQSISFPAGMEGRAYHTASVVDDTKIWVVGI